MSVYGILISLHVVIAIGGVGQLGAIALAARHARSSPLAAAEVIARSLRVTRYALIAMFISGALLDASLGGAYHGSMWFRASVVLMLLTGFAHARASAALRHARESGEPAVVARGEPAVVARGEPARALAGVERWSWVACALVAFISVLMEVKPG